MGCRKRRHRPAPLHWLVGSDGFLGWFIASGRLGRSLGRRLNVTATLAQFCCGSGPDVRVIGWGRSLPLHYLNPVAIEPIFVENNASRRGPEPWMAKLIRRWTAFETTALMPPLLGR